MAPSQVDKEDKSYLPSITFRFDDLFTDDGAISIALICVFAILLLILFLIVYNLTRLCRCCQTYPSSKRTENKLEEGIQIQSSGSGARKLRRPVSSPHVKAFLTSPPIVPIEIKSEKSTNANNKPPTFIFGWFGAKPN